MVTVAVRWIVFTVITAPRAAAASKQTLLLRGMFLGLVLDIRAYVFALDRAVACAFAVACRRTTFRGFRVAGGVVAVDRVRAVAPFVYVIAVVAIPGRAGIMIQTGFLNLSHVGVVCADVFTVSILRRIENRAALATVPAETGVVAAVQFCIVIATIALVIFEGSVVGTHRIVSSENCAHRTTVISHGCAVSKSIIGGFQRVVTEDDICSAIVTIPRCTIVVGNVSEALSERAFIICFSN